MSNPSHPSPHSQETRRAAAHRRSPLPPTPPGGFSLNQVIPPKSVPPQPIPAPSQPLPQPSTAANSPASSEKIPSALADALSQNTTRTFVADHSATTTIHAVQKTHAPSPNAPHVSTVTSPSVADSPTIAALPTIAAPPEASDDVERSLPPSSAAPASQVVRTLAAPHSLRMPHFEIRSAASAPHITSNAVSSTTSASNSTAVATGTTVKPVAQPTVIPAPVTPPAFVREHIQAVRLYKQYKKGNVAVPVLTDLSIDVHRGEFLAIVGQSGSGKSTLLHLLGTLDTPDRGEIYHNGNRIDNISARQKDRLRNGRFGMIFQFYHLLPELTTLENVLSPLMISHGFWKYLNYRKKHRERAKNLLDIVGLSHRLKHRPRELSGGEMQRAAIARALIAEPELLLADEPTGNLDQTTGREILDLLRTLNRRENLTIVMVTHDLELARQADRIVRLAGGQIE